MTRALRDLKDGHPACPCCHYGRVITRDDGLCDDCGASEDLHEIAGDDEEFAEVVRAFNDERDAAIAAMDAGASP